MVELEERMPQRMLEKLEQQKEDIHKKLQMIFLDNLSVLYPSLQLNAATLASLGAQAPQEDMQLLNHLSSRKNNPCIKVIVFLLLHLHNSLT